MSFNLVEIFLIIVVCTIGAAILSCIISAVYNSWLRTRYNSEIYSSIIYTPVNVSGPRYNTETTTHDILNYESDDYLEEYFDPLPVYEPRNTSTSVNTLVHIDESNEVLIQVDASEPVYDPFDRPPKY